MTIVEMSTYIWMENKTKTIFAMKFSVEISFICRNKTAKSICGKFVWKCTWFHSCAEFFYWNNLFGFCSVFLFHFQFWAADFLQIFSLFYSFILIFFFFYSEVLNLLSYLRWKTKKKSQLTCSRGKSFFHFPFVYD